MVFFSCLKYSAINQRLLIKWGHEFLIINIEQKRVEFKVGDMIGRSINRFQLFGEKENKIASFSGFYLSLLIFNHKMRKLVSFEQCGIGLNLSRHERMSALAVSDHNDFVLLAIKCRWVECDRVMIFEIRRNKFVLKATLKNKGIQDIRNLSCCGYYGNHILWVGFESGARIERAIIYDFDTETKELRELREKRTQIQARAVKGVHRFGNDFYYTSCIQNRWISGKIFRLWIKL